jgi:hypothetical protein
LFSLNSSSQGFTLNQMQHSIIGAYNGSGLSCVDFNQDGWDDITFCTRNEPVKFYLNSQGTFILTSLVDHQGEIKSALWADIDNDLDQDLLLTTFEGFTKLYKNLGDLVFEDVSEQNGIPQLSGAMSYGASFGDFNRDGSLDLYICNYNWPEGITNWLLVNDGTGKFFDISNTTCASDMNRRSFQSTFLDFNNDLWADLFVINDKQTRNSLYLNSNGEFSDVSVESGTDHLMESMSNSPCDFDHDGDLDIYITNGPFGNVFLRNDNGQFVDIAPELGMTVGTLCWGALWIDYDADGWEDLYICDIFEYFGDYNRWFRNNGDGTFSSVTPQGMTVDNYRSYANAIGDFNNDSKPDIVVVNDDGVYSVMWENTSSSSNYLSLDLQGVYSNTDGVGAWIHVFVGDTQQHHYSLSGENYLAQNSKTEFFGLGTNTAVDSVIVEWPSGLVDHFYNLQGNTEQTLIEGDSYSLQLSLSSDTTLCAGDSVFVQTNLMDNVIWNDAFQGTERWISSSGQYSATAEILPNFILATDVITIQIAPPIEYESFPSNLNCFEANDGEIQIQSEVPYINWENGESNFFIDSLSAGVYYFELTNYFGCSKIDSVLVTQPLPIVLESSQSDPVNGANGWIELVVDGGTPPYQYQWNIKGSSNVILNAQQGNYTCLITDSNGCQIGFETSMIDLNLEEITDLDKLIWNSNTNSLKIPSASHGNLKVFDSSGRLVYDETVHSNDLIDLSSLSKGVYSVSFLKSNVESFESMLIVLEK